MAKRRSAKQLANDKRLGRMAKARSKKSAPKRRKVTKSRKTIKPVKRRSTVAKRRRTATKRRSVRSITSKIPFVNNPTVRKVATGIGLATIGVTAINFIASSLARHPIVKPALAFLGGGIPGVIGQLVVGGGISQLTSLGGSGNSSANIGNNGFA